MEAGDSWFMAGVYAPYKSWQQQSIKAPKAKPRTSATPLDTLHPDTALNGE